MKDQIIFVCYDIKLRNYFTTRNIRWLLTGLNENNKRSFWVYDNTDENVRYILNKWRNKELVFN